MARHHVFAGLGAIGALIVTPATQAQAQAANPAQPGDLELSCPALAMEMGKAAQLMAQTATAAPAAAATSTAPGALAGLMSAAGGSKLEEAGRMLQQQQNAQQLANLQVMAARGGVNPGTAGAAIGGLAAMQQMAANGGNMGDAARAAATDRVSGELAKRIPGGALIGGMMGGMFKKKPKPVAVVAAAPAEANGAQARLGFLSALLSAKGCK